MVEPAGRGAEWLFNGTGIGASNQFEAGGFIRSRPEFKWPNIQYHFLPVAINYNGSNGVKEHGFQAHMGSMRSPSRGRIQAKSKDPRQHPSILFNYMSSEQDWQEFRDGIRLTREIMAQPALDPYRGREISPGAHVQTDEELDKFIREHAETAFHPSCSCKMGTDDMAVVDGEGRARHAGPARSGCLDHAVDHHRQPQRHHDHDCRENLGQDPWSQAVATQHRQVLRGW